MNNEAFIKAVCKKFYDFDIWLSNCNVSDKDTIKAALQSCRDAGIDPETLGYIRPANNNNTGGACGPMPEEPDDDAPFDEKLAWLLLTHGFCEQLDRVVKLYEPSSDCLLTRPAFTFSRKPWQEVIIGPNGGETTVTWRRSGRNGRSGQKIRANPDAAGPRIIRPTSRTARPSRTPI